MPFEIARLPASFHLRGPALFISDLHLSPALPRTVAAFDALLQGPARAAGELFILGDFFEYWVGDDMLDTDPDDPASFGAFARDIAARLAALGATGVPIYIMPGNRDFLLGQRFARSARATLLHDPCIVERFGQRIVLTHGDMLCRDDAAYMRYRRVVRSPRLQRLFLALPLRFRMAVAERLRARSAGAQQRKIYDDVDHAAARELFSCAEAPTLIHGHTHRPACHEDRDARGRSTHRWVLTDWECDHGQPRAGYLQWDADGLRAVPYSAPVEPAAR
ncbi:MAG: UDP-2,3-diacylglucosamine diphosphatase [Burkholderiales bacterium]|nr:UDP-2,3-diacylglucosamine diphosphatase [Burkholderiales bacterium]MDE2288329.1 UDP-2,3-diacylglucosamine diphosphatase [Burkholderiales bacterium]MDE2609840.1 UDP-2,3-diacylglucosamine diphosphatase [Burkholderiales bacterium]